LSKSSFVDFVRTEYPGFSPGLSHLSPDLVAPTAVCLSEAVKTELYEGVRTLIQLVRQPRYETWLRQQDDGRLRDYPRTGSLVTGYDFYVTPEGPKLIEINTNAAAGILCFLLHRYHQTGCVSPHFFEELRQVVMDQTHTVFSQSSPSHVIILDEHPAQQQAYFEFLWFQSLMESWGWPTQILDPQDFPSQFSQPTAVYNRFCDFDLSEQRSLAILQAYLDRKICLMPNPLEFAALSDKSRFLDWSSDIFLTEVGMTKEEIVVIRRMIPQVYALTTDNAAELWEKRKSFYFKPRQSYGGKSVYAGKSISRSVFQRMVDIGALAQPAFSAPFWEWDMPGEGRLSFRYDVRVYVIGDQIAFSAARLFRGQVTNFRTPFGGFSPVIFEDSLATSGTGSPGTSC